MVSAARLYLIRLDDLWASLFVASLPPAPGLTASSCSCGREFATRFFQLRLAATPCGSLRLPSSAPVGSFHPTRFCPCWAHWGGRPHPRGTPTSRQPGSGGCSSPCRNSAFLPGDLVLRAVQRPLQPLGARRKSKRHNTVPARQHK